MAQLNKTVREYARNIKLINPLVHNISNYVTIHDCANITLAVGARPVMADYFKESSYVTRKCRAAVFNMGMMNDEKASAMKVSGDIARDKGIPVVFDPVGVGISPYRYKCFDMLRQYVDFGIIRGNASEILTIAGIEATKGGVDCADQLEIRELKLLAEQTAVWYDAVIFISGKTDVISDGKRTAVLYSDVPELKYVTGAGCMLSSLTGAFAGANPDMFGAAVAASAFMSYCAKIALKRARGNAGLSDELINTVYRYMQTL